MDALRNRFFRVRYRYFLVSDLATVALCLFFAACSFLNLKKTTITLEPLGGMVIDRGLSHGLLYLLLAGTIPLFCRWADRVRKGPLRFFRLFYVQALYGLFFQECIILSQLFYNGRSLDAFFARADLWLFGVQPARQFHQLLPESPCVTEFFFFGYFFYFILVIGSFWLLFFRGEEGKAARALAITTVSFYLFYIFYTFFPVQGPKYFLPDLNRLFYTNFDGFFFTRFMTGIFAHMNLAGAAFPSSHVGVSLIALILNWKHNRFLAIVFIPFTLLLFAATVYIYAHYFVDIPAGIAAGALFYLLVPLLLKRLEPALAEADGFLGRLLGKNCIFTF